MEISFIIRISNPFQKTLQKNKKWAILYMDKCSDCICKKLDSYYTIWYCSFSNVQLKVKLLRSLNKKTQKSYMEKSITRNIINEAIGFIYTI